MEHPAILNRRDQVVYTTIVGLTLAVVVGAAVASFLIGRYYRDQEAKGRCEYLGRLLAAELNQPAAQELIVVRCLQSK